MPQLVTPKRQTRQKAAEHILSSFEHLEQYDLNVPLTQEHLDSGIPHHHLLSPKCESLKSSCQEQTGLFFFVIVRRTASIWVYTCADLIYTKYIFIFLQQFKHIDSFNFSIGFNQRNVLKLEMNAF